MRVHEINVYNASGNESYVVSAVEFAMKSSLMKDLDNISVDVDFTVMLKVCIDAGDGEFIEIKKGTCVRR